MEERGRRLEPLSPVPLALLVLAILGLAAVVVAASRSGGQGPSGPAGTAVTEAAIIRAGVILVAVAEVVVFGLIAWALWPGERRARRVGHRKGSLAVAVASFLQTASVLVLFWLWLHYRARFGGSGQGLLGGLAPPRTFASLPGRAFAVAGGQEWLTLVIVLAVLGLAATRLLRGIRFGRRGSPLARLAGRLQEAVEESLEELEGEPDPRRAVIAAYARMERSLARVGLARARHEAAFEYLGRLLGLLDASVAPAQRLTDLYQVARFSEHPIDESMKKQAINSLFELRDELRERAAAGEPVGEAAPA